MFAEHRIIDDNLLQEFDQIVRQISRHECLDGHRDLLGILRFSECRLNHLIDQRASVLIVLS